MTDRAEQLSRLREFVSQTHSTRSFAGKGVAYDLLEELEDMLRRRQPGP